MPSITHAQDCHAGLGPNAICTCGAWKRTVAEQLAETDAAYAPKGAAQTKPVPKSDPVNPPHYKAHPSGVECIAVTEHMNFNLGNAVKYIWRADEKGDPIENLRKARWYIEREIARRAPKSPTISDIVEATRPLVERNWVVAEKRAEAEHFKRHNL